MVPMLDGAMPGNGTTGGVEPAVAESESSTARWQCPACGGGAFIRRRILPDLRTQTCTSCRLVLSTIDRAGPAVSEFALVDEAAYLRSVGETRRRQAERILASLISHVRPGATLLDVGCSFGFFLLAAGRAGFQVRGLEPDAQAHEYARRLLGEGIVRQGILDAQSEPAASADVVSTLDVIEHIPAEQHEEFAATVRKVLRPGGVWVIKVPSTEGLYYRLSDLLARTAPSLGASLVRRMWQTRYEYPHLVYFSRGSLSLWLGRFGFDVLGHRYLPEVPSRTILDRLTTDGDISRPTAYLIAPALIGVNLVEWVRGKSDGLVMFARPRS